jgi:uroporphyrinogen-III synthase
VTSDRRSEDLIAALERRGAAVTHAPALRIARNEQDAMLVRETGRLIAARPEVVLITTGYGMRRWLEVADAAGLGGELTAVLEQARIFARGPKAVGAVRAAGLVDAEASDADTTASLVDSVAEAGLTGRRVAVQLHGFTDEAQLVRLRALSETVLTVTPYRWMPPAAPERLYRLIESVCQGQLDAVIFTSAPGAAATLATAKQLKLTDAFLAALSGPTLAAAVGPVTAEPLVAMGVRPVIPVRYRLGALIRLVCDELSERHVVRYRCGDVGIEVRGRSVTVNGRHILLGPNALALFTALANSSAVISRAELSRGLPEPLVDHAVEVAVSRLRRALDVPGLITTVVRRGYRFTGERIWDEAGPESSAD